MKRLFLALALVLAVPAMAGAQQAPGSPSPMRQAMHANMQQMMKLHQQFRAQLLGALTPAHKQLYATVVGNLAIAASPDPRAAVKQLDAALSTSEKTAILNANTQFMTAMKSMRQQMMANHPWPSPSGSPWPKRSHGQRKPHTPDAGAILLGMAGGHGGMMMGRMHGGGPGMGHP
ncbi:MAG: hypothetical protein WBA06_04050 [Candidatus Aquilonibacter sp.]